MWSRLRGITTKLRGSDLWQWLAGRRRRALWWTLTGALLLLYGWALLIALRPTRVVGPAASLAAYGRPGVAVKIARPLAIDPSAVGQAARPLTIMARADAAAATTPLTFVMAPTDDAVALVDREGRHISGRVTMTPGFPEWTPSDIWVAYGETQAGARLFGRHMVQITPSVVTAAGVEAVTELGFALVVEGSVRPATRGLARAWLVIFPVLVITAVLTFFVVARWQRQHRQVRLSAERLLAGRYVQLRSHIKLEQWEQARHEIDAIQTQRAEYRDVGRLDVLVSAAETASWRREQLYSSGLEAYQQRHWPAAAQALAALELENPYYREVRFLKRTAELYADLGSRDRSLRSEAAKRLGQVGDLVDFAPLIEALGDGSSAVADEVELAFHQIGVQAADDLIGALRHPKASVRRRAFHLLQQMGRTIHDHLLAGLRSADPAVTRSVARLLGHVGAGEDLARALLWLEPAHHDGIRRALAHEGVAAVQPLVQTLFEAPPERRQAFINVLSGLLDQEEVRQRVEELARSTRDPKQRAFLHRVVEAPREDRSQALEVVPEAPASSQVVAEDAAEGASLARRILRRLDRGQ